MKINKIAKNTILTLALLCFTLLLNAQDEKPESLRDRIARRQQQQDPTKQATGNSINIPKLSVRAQKMNEEQAQDLSHATWIREIYRFLHLGKGKNAALYYPVQPVDNRMNLFTVIFKLMGDAKLAGYEFNDSKELFTEDKKVKFEDVLSRLEIPFQQNGNVFSYDEFSIPNSEVLGYYIKEAWYFDQSNSMLGVKTVAVCPVVFREEYLDGISTDAPVSRRPQFWIKYDDIRPYAAMMPIMTSDKNNVMNKTIDDYFRLRLYDGEIYKATNMEDKLLVEKYKTEEEVKQAQERIEKELVGFNQNLWVTNDSINAAKNVDKKSQTKVNKSKPAKSKSVSSQPAFRAKDRK